MAAPNLNSSTLNIYKKSTGAALTGTVTTSLLANASGSGKLLEATCIVVSNVNGSASTTVTLDVLKNAATGYHIAYQVPVAAGAAVVYDVKGLHLEENDTLRGGAANSSYAEVLINYNEFS